MDEQPVAPGPKRVSVRSRRMAVSAAFLAGIAVAGIRVAAAQDSSTSSTTSPATPPSGPAKLHGLGRFGDAGPGGPGRFGLGPMGAIHGEFVTPDGNGGFRTLDVQRGQVTSVSPDSITLKSDDGFTKKYSVDENTVVNSGRDGIGSVKNGDTAMVTAAVDGGTARAMNIVDRTTLGNIRDHWFPKQQKPNG